MPRHWEYSSADFTPEGDEELAELYRLTESCEGLYHEPAEGRDG